MAVTIRDKYFEWLVNIVTQDRFDKNISFNKLFTQLHDTQFTYSLPLDRNRAYDGRDLRYRFTSEYGCPDRMLDDLPRICSVLEMMIALSVRCEEAIMGDPMYGDRTAQWFWLMVGNLGLAGCYDSNYDAAYVTGVLTDFLTRNYGPDGKGGLFHVRDCEFDMSRVEIWHQLLRYLDTVAGYDI